MHLSGSQLDRAVREGIITAGQRERLLALGAVPADAPAFDPASPPDGAAVATVERAPAIVVAYTVGALAVLFAFGWFLVERWERLGPAGVLAVVLVYAAVFAGTSRWLAKEGFPLAAAFAALLAVGMTPVATWAVLRLTGMWEGAPYAELPGRPAYDAWRNSTRWALIELATALAALVGWRLTRFAPLVLPVAVAGWLAPLNLAAPFLEGQVAGGMFAWGSLAAAAGLLLVAYRVDVSEDRVAGAGLAFDPAGWIYRVVIVAFLAGIAGAWGDAAFVPYLLLLLAAVGVQFALALGRRELLGAALFAFVSWLGYLAFDVFEQVLSFPIVLASFGTILILMTVAAQRRWPALAQRLAAARTGRRRLPGGYRVPVGLFLLMLAFLPFAPTLVERAQHRRDREAVERQRRERVRVQRERAAGRGAPARTPRRQSVPARRGTPPAAETPPPKGP